jgi:hypothetical protein
MIEMKRHLEAEETLSCTEGETTTIVLKRESILRKKTELFIESL